jgi:hypothetical protein
VYHLSCIRDWFKCNAGGCPAHAPCPKCEAPYDDDVYIDVFTKKVDDDAARSDAPLGDGDGDDAGPGSLHAQVVAFVRAAGEADMFEITLSVTHAKCTSTPRVPPALTDAVYPRRYYVHV